MTEDKDKEARLRDIKDRLEEIQKNVTSGNSSPASNGGAVKKEATEKSRTGNAVKKTIQKEAKSTQEDLNWQANKAKDINADKRKKKASASLIYTIASLIISLGIICYLAYTLLIDDGNEVKETATEQIDAEKNSGHPELSQDEVPQVPVEAEESSPVSEDVKSEAGEITASVRETKPEPSPLKEERSEPFSSSSVKLPSGYIISYSTNSTREAAEKNVRQLKGQGYTAYYYYMPDKTSGSQALYKVYLGPYKDEAAAFPDFRKIAAINKQCYILRVD